MDLQSYPDAIAKLQTKSAQIYREIVELEDCIADATSLIDAEVAFDETLKNEGQRKAKRLEMCRNSEEINDLSEAIAVLKNQNVGHSIEIERLKSSLSVEKLLLREKIAIFGKVTD